MAVLTVSCAVPACPPKEAVIVATPAALPNNRPGKVTKATVVSDESQLQSKVMSWVVESLKVPVALKSCVAPD